MGKVTDSTTPDFWTTSGKPLPKTIDPSIQTFKTVPID